MPNTESPRTRGIAVPILVGALFGVVAVAIAVGAMTLVRRVAPPDADTPVAIVLAGTGGSGTTVAQGALLVTGDKQKAFSAEESVTIPGTSFSHLGDAYSFGGGQMVAQALSGGADSRYVSVPEPAWADAVDAAGGIEVTLTAQQDIFNGNKLVSVPKGPSRLEGGSLNALLAAVPFMPADDVRTVRDDIIPRVVMIVAASGVGPGDVDTDLTEQEFRELFSRIAQGSGPTSRQ